MILFFTISLCFFLGLGLLFFYISFKNTFKVRVESVRVKTSQTQIHPLHILHLSDMHFEKLSIKPDVLYETVKELPIDLIAITGDLIEKKKNIEPFMEYIKWLQKLGAPLGIFVVFGNHDFYLGKNLLTFRRKLESAGCIVLQNENLSVKHGDTAFNIIGVDNHSSRKSNLPKSFKGIKEGVNLVLTHDPNVIIKMDAYPFDYMLAGHFHGGQIHWPKPFHMVKYGPIARMDMIRGLHYYKGRPFYISEGLGQSGAKLRFGTFPEVTLHRVE